MRYIINALSWREINSSHRLMTAIVITLGVLSLFLGELVPAGGGFGWDGVLYARMTRNLESMISEGQLSNYYAHRILPSAIVRSAMVLSGASFSNISIIRGFEVYNLVLLVGACRIWKRLANNFSVSLGGRWLGFCGLFLSYMASKQTFYEPVLTDVTALFVGLLALLFYVEQRPIALFATTLVGAFAWALVGISGATLLFFLHTQLSPEVIDPASFPYSYTMRSAKLSRLTKVGWVALLVFSAFCVACLASAGTVLDIPKLASRLADLSVSGRVNRIASRLMTAAPSIVGLTIALALLAGSVLFFRAVMRNLCNTRLRLVVLAIAAVTIPWGIVRGISNPSIPNASGAMLLTRLSLFPPNGKFLLPLVSLAVYWGPVVLLLLLNWRAFCREARKLGPGFTAVVGLNLLFGLSTEPRFVTFAWPFLVLGAVLAIEKLYRRPSFKYAFAALTVLYSQFWMKINLAPWTGGDFENLLDFPKQVLFMHYGLWMSWWSYSLQLCALILSALWLRSSMLPVRAARRVIIIEE